VPGGRSPGLQSESFFTVLTVAGFVLRIVKLVTSWQPVAAMEEWEIEEKRYGESPSGRGRLEFVRARKRELESLGEVMPPSSRLSTTPVG
jgi:hypothetical protein